MQVKSIEIRKEGGRWKKLAASQWDFALWSVACHYEMSRRDAETWLKAGHRPYVQDFGGAYLRAA